MAANLKHLPQQLKLEDNPVQNWQIFKQRWTAYTVLSNFNEQALIKQKAILINCLSDEAMQVYNSFKIEENTTVQNIFKLFENYIIGSTNDTYERFKFNKRSQNEEENFDSFLADLQRLIKTCNYCPECEQSLLKDRIVLGVRDSQTQKELLKINDLSLQKTIDICKASEKATIQNKDMKKEVVVNKIRNSEKPKADYLKQCKFCGNKHVFSKNSCPAYGKSCSICGRDNHFAVVCNFKQKDSSNRKKIFKKKVYNINEISDSDSDGQEWINKVTKKNDQSAHEKQVFCKMLVNKENVKFQIDTGSSVNIIPESYLTKDNVITSTQTSLRTWTNNNYQPVGECRLIIKNPKTSKKYNVNFIVCNDNLMPILGLNASKQMKLVEVKDENFEQIFTVYESKIFNDELGCLAGECKLKINENVKPVIMPSKRIPIALRPILKNELDRLENKQVIAKIEEPTEWVSQVVLTKKKNGKARLCIDPRELNKALLREHYTLPIMDDILHELGESKFFSKADLANGYWHINLDEESSKLTTFQTYYGRYRWKRLPFGLSVSSEIFQRKLTERQ